MDFWGQSCIGFSYENEPKGFVLLKVARLQNPLNLVRNCPNIPAEYVISSAVALS